MHFYVTLTLNCNLQCRYCYGKCIDDFGQPFPFKVDNSLPSSITYNVADLAEFLKQDPEPTLIFYGGEPTLALDKMREIMDNVPAKAYMMQTNGLLLDKLEPAYSKRFHTVLISLDGDEALTDYYRGKGTYRRVIENLKLFRSRGFRGEFIARMTVDPETDLCQAVKWLLSNEGFPFESVHWQLDAQFWKRDYEKERVKKWFERYNRDVRSLIEDWVSNMEAKGKVLRIYPLIGVAESLITRRSEKLRCGAGWTEFNIQTDGKITPCPVMAGMKDFYLGSIRDTDLQSLANAILVKEPCPQCSVYEICGGRCLYANATKLWGSEGYRLVCETVENLVNSLKAVKSRMCQAVSSGKINAADFSYPKYNSCEIIP
ncbi:MAG: TIGR04084 family radical SAM/SPASM domain-containing protein [Candidatus Bathyarchaeota archaeon]